MTAAPQTAAAPALRITTPPASSVRVNVAWVFGANAIYLACQWLILTVVAKLGSTEMVGQLSLGFAITAPVFLLSNLRLRTVQATDAGIEYSPSDYIGVRIVTTVLALAAIVVLLAVRPLGTNTSAVVLCVALAKAFESGSDLLYGFFQQQDRTSRMTASIMVRGVCSVTAVALVSYYRHDAVSASAALCVSSVLLLLLCDLPLASGLLRQASGRVLTTRWHWPTLYRLARAAFPLGLSAMLMALGANMPRYFIEKSFGTREVGIFSAVWYLATSGGYLVSALAEGASPNLGRLHVLGDQAGLYRLLKLLLGIALLIGLVSTGVALVAGKALLGRIYNAEYQTGRQLLVWLSLAGVMANAASIFSYGMISARKYRDHLIALIVMTVASAAGCQLLLPVLGVNGAAVALMAGYLLQAGWGFVALSRAPQSVRPA